MRYTIQIRHTGSGGVATEAAIRAAVQDLIGTLDAPVLFTVPAYQGDEPGVYSIELEERHGHTGTPDSVWWIPLHLRMSTGLVAEACSPAPRFPRY